jgi:arabinofuranosyltransferase
MMQHIGRAISGRTATLLALAGPLVIFAWAAWSRRWLADDGYVYLRVVQQLKAGHGPVFNQGERIESATGPLWVGVLTVASLVLRPVPLPWLAVILGLLFSLAGLAFGQWGAYRLWQPDRNRIVLPLGSIIVIALPPFWDFATSGLETGLAFAWLGACFWGLVELSRRADESGPATQQRGAPAWLLPTIGLGLLIRSDFGIFVLAFMAAVFILRPRLGWLARLRGLALALAVPLTYEVFRMGYYAALVPNPAFAKEAAQPYWHQGLRYVVDTAKPYWLPVPVLLLFAPKLPSWFTAYRRGERRGRMVLIALLMTAAVCHSLYVLYVGGDFMHARMLLPALFTLLLPVAVVGVDTIMGGITAAALVVWAVVCAATLRTPYDAVGPHFIANERGFYVAQGNRAHPIMPEDYPGTGGFTGTTLALRERALLSHGELLLFSELLVSSGGKIALPPDMRPDEVAVTYNAGVFSYVLGPDVHVVDAFGLGDPIGARLMLTKRAWPGHEKILAESWSVARFSDPTVALPPHLAPSLADIEAARNALSCDGARRLLDAVRQPLTPGRFARNLIESFRLQSFRIPGAPVEAQAKLC